MIITKRYQAEDLLIKEVERLINDFSDDIRQKHTISLSEFSKCIKWSNNKSNLNDSTELFMEYTHTYRAMAYAYDFCCDVLEHGEYKGDGMRFHKTELFLINAIDKHAKVISKDPNLSKHYGHILMWHLPNGPVSLQFDMIKLYEGGIIEALCSVYDKTLDLVAENKKGVSM